MSGNDRSIRVLLTVIVVLLGANVVINLGARDGSHTAYGAGIPDTGAQIQSLVDQMTELNKKVDKVDEFLESGNLSVKVQEPKNEK